MRIKRAVGMGKAYMDRGYKGDANISRQNEVDVVHAI